MTVTTTSYHYNDWPNDQGLDGVYEEKAPIELPVSGSIPAYAAGVLYRTGPGRRTVDTDDGGQFKMDHWFDGFTQTHRFQLIAPDDSNSSMRVFYNSRFSTDRLIETARKNNSLQKFTFGQRDPCKTAYRKAQSEYVKAPDPSFDNIGVTLSVNMPGLDSPNNSTLPARWTDASGIRSLTAKTDASIYKKLDPQTLEPIGVANQGVLHPDLTGPLSASHARSDPKSGDVYNYNMVLAPEPTYRVFRVSASTGKTEILASFPGKPAYIHSLLITENHVILCVWNGHLEPSNLQRGSIMQAFKPFDASQHAKWYVVDRKNSRGLIAVYNSKPFFAFHTINSWEEVSSQDPSKTDIVAEVITFESLVPLEKLYYENILSSSPSAKAFAQDRQDSSRSSLARFRLRGIPASATPSPAPAEAEAVLEWTALTPLSPELPTLNLHFTTRPHRYTYAVIDRNESTFFDGIVKFDSQTKKALTWATRGHSPGEPIFVPDPEGTGEDDGVLLSVVLDGAGSGTSYLLVLDARDLREVGRARVPGPVAFGFHGQFVASGDGGGEARVTGDY